jgi:hypothetical protein
MPNAIVDKSMAIAKPGPRTPHIVINMKGLMRGEVIRNDITGAMGTPVESIAANIGITAYEPKGETTPNRVARTIETNPPFLLQASESFCVGTKTEIREPRTIPMTTKYQSRKNIFTATDHTL